RSIVQSLKPLQAVSLHPFVAGLARKTEPSTQSRFALSACFHGGHKFHALFHCTGLRFPHRQALPADQSTCYPCRRSILLPMYPVWTTLPSPPRGRGRIDWWVRMRLDALAAILLMLCCAIAPVAAQDWRAAWDQTLAAAKKEGSVVVSMSPS